MRARTGPQKHNARQRDGFHAVKILLGRRKSIEPAAISHSWTLKDASHNRSFSRSSDEQPGLCERGVVMWCLNFLGEHNLSDAFPAEAIRLFLYRPALRSNESGDSQHSAWYKFLYAQGTAITSIKLVPRLSWDWPPRGTRSDAESSYILTHFPDAPVQFERL